MIGCVSYDRVCYYSMFVVDCYHEISNQRHCLQSDGSLCGSPGGGGGDGAAAVVMTIYPICCHRFSDQQVRQPVRVGL